MPWKFTQIRELCDTNHLPYPEVYLRSLSWQHRKAWYHAQQAQKVWDDFKAAHPRHEIGGSNEQWWEVYYASAAETEATVQVLHAEADIIAQIANRIILRGLVPERDVNLHRVLCELKCQNRGPHVAAQIETLKSSREFRYINAFCNTIKHRRLIDKQWHVEGGEGTRNKEDVRFLAFCYEGKPFPITWASDITGPYRKRLRRYDEAIGDAIIDYLQSNP